MNPNQIGKIARRPRGDAALRVETTRAPIQATGDGGVAAAPVRARPWALRYDFLTRLHPIQSAATNGRLITSSKTSDAAATLAVCCGRGRPRSRTAPVLGRRGMISYPTSAQPNTPQRTATSTRHQQQAMRPFYPYAAAAGDGRAPSPHPAGHSPGICGSLGRRSDAAGCQSVSNRVKPLFPLPRPRSGFPGSRAGLLWPFPHLSRHNEATADQSHSRSQWVTPLRIFPPKQESVGPDLRI
jgi:hypothetical protein